MRRDAGWRVSIRGRRRQLSQWFMLGLAVGKPVGIVLPSPIAVRAGLCRLPLDLAWRHVIGAGLLGGIGFTMSIFIANLASGLLGYAWLKLRGAPPACAKYTVWVG